MAKSTTQSIEPIIADLAKVENGESQLKRVFSSKTTTIDMFGSAKYRSYEYGGDDGEIRSSGYARHCRRDSV